MAGVTPSMDGGAVCRETTTRCPNLLARKTQDLGEYAQHEKQLVVVVKLCYTVVLEWLVPGNAMGGAVQ